jgi:putative phage-type endonuclease
MSTETKELVLTAPEGEIDRRSGVGGSDVAAILGLDPKRSPFDVWLEKRGDAPAFVQNNRTRWGTRLQKAIADGYGEETGRQVRWLDTGMRHPERGFHTGHPDAICIPHQEDRALEVKNAGADQLHRWGPRGTDEVPERAYFQGLWYMPLLQVTRIDFAVLFGGNDLGIYTVARDEDLEGTVIERVEKFWRDHVLANAPPEISATNTAKEYLRSRFPRHLEPLRLATEDEMLIAKMYHAANVNAERMEKRAEDLKMRLKLSIGEAAGLQGDGWQITYKASKNVTKTEWESIARGFGNKYPDEFKALVGLHSREVPGSRRFLPKFTEEEKEIQANG